MAHDESIGHGTKLMRSSDGTSAGTFTTVGRIRDVTPPELSRDTVDTSDMESEDRWRTYIGAMKDAGELEFEMTFDPGSDETTDFMGDLNDDDPGYYKLVFPDATEWGFTAILTSFAPAVPFADKMVTTIRYKLSGKPGWIA